MNKYVVSLVLVHDKGLLMNVVNNLTSHEAHSREEAFGMAMILASKKLPNHRLHIWTCLDLGPA